jgi:hypothetical protein
MQKGPMSSSLVIALFLEVVTVALAALLSNLAAPALHLSAIVALTLFAVATILLFIIGLKRQQLESAAAVNRSSQSLAAPKRSLLRQVLDGREFLIEALSFLGSPRSSASTFENSSTESIVRFARFIIFTSLWFTLIEWLGHSASWTGSSCALALVAQLAMAFFFAMVCSGLCWILRVGKTFWGAFRVSVVAFTLTGVLMTPFLAVGDRELRVAIPESSGLVEPSLTVPTSPIDVGSLVSAPFIEFQECLPYYGLDNCLVPESHHRGVVVNLTDQGIAFSQAQPDDSFAALVFYRKLALALAATLLTVGDLMIVVSFVILWMVLLRGHPRYRWAKSIAGVTVSLLAYLSLTVGIFAVVRSPTVNSCQIYVPKTPTFNPGPLTFATGHQCADPPLLAVGHKISGQSVLESQFQKSQEEQNVGVAAHLRDRLAARIWINNGAGEEHPSENIARDVNASLKVREASPGVFRLSATVRSSNAPTIASSSASYGGDSTVRVSARFKLVYVPGSTRLCVSNGEAQRRSAGLADGPASDSGVCSPRMELQAPDGLVDGGLDIGSVWPGFNSGIWILAEFSVVNK